MISNSMKRQILALPMKLSSHLTICLGCWPFSCHHDKVTTKVYKWGLWGFCRLQTENCASFWSNTTRKSQFSSSHPFSECVFGFWCPSICIYNKLWYMRGIKCLNIFPFAGTQPSQPAAFPKVSGTTRKHWHRYILIYSTFALDL